MSRRLSILLLGIAVYLGGWFPKDSAQALQLLSIGLLILSCLLALMGGRVKRIPAQPFELILIAAFIWATVIPYFDGNSLSVLYGVLFTVAFVSISYLCRDRNPDQLLAIFRWVYLALVLSIFATQSQELLAALSGTTIRETGLLRFAPLGLHPNLGGLVYGGGTVLFLQQLMDGDRKGQKIISALAALACAAIVIAASARSGLLALAVTAILGLLIIAVRGSRRTQTLLVVGTVGIALFLFSYARQVSSYLTLMLDLDSSTRGLDSGATGRFELWERGISLIMADPVTLLFGRGIRSAGVERIGFPVESSYINLVLELGIIFTVLIVGRVMFLAFKLINNFPKSAEIGHRRLFMGLMLVFALIQSIFNRYLIAAGNPYSLIVFFLCVMAELELWSSVNRAGYDMRR